MNDRLILCCITSVSVFGEEFLRVALWSVDGMGPGSELSASGCLLEDRQPVPTSLTEYICLMSPSRMSVMGVKAYRLLLRNEQAKKSYKERTNKTILRHFPLDDPVYHFILIYGTRSKALRSFTTSEAPASQIPRIHEAAQSLPLIMPSKQLSNSLQSFMTTTHPASVNTFLISSSFSGS